MSRPVRPAALAFIFVTVMLDMLALGVIIPVLPKLVEGFLGGNTVRAAELYGLFGASWAFMQFLCSPFFGALSDRIGRRPIILISNLGLGLDYLLMALAPNLWLLFVGRLISGITSASIGTAFAYIADVTPEDQRARSFGMLGVAFGLGFIMGPAMGGILGGVDARLPFYVAAGLSFLNFLYGLTILPESLARELRSPFRLARANPVGSLMLLRSHSHLLGLASVHFLMQVAHAVLPTVAVLYMGKRYGWGELQVGLVLAGVGLSSAIVQGGAVGPVVRRLGEVRTLLVGLSFGALGFALYGIADTGLVFLVGVPVMSLWGLAGPALQGLMSAQVSNREQGSLQGANASISGIAEIIGPLVFAGTFATFLVPHGGWELPGAPFFIAALLLAASVPLAWLVARRGLHRPGDPEPAHRPG